MVTDGKDGVDRFFDKVDSVVEKVVGTLKHVHHPDKEYAGEDKHPDAEDAVIVNPIAERVDSMSVIVHVGGHVLRLHFKKERCAELFGETRVTIGEWLTVMVEEAERQLHGERLLGKGE